MISVHAAGQPGSTFHLALGDLPTWLLAVIASLAFVAAVRAYQEQVKTGKDLADQVKVQQQALEDQRKASKALADQAELQRQVLADQQAANAKQAEVLDAQLAELSRQARAAERQQADAVVFTPKQRIAPEGTSGEVDGKLAHMAVVMNGSQRPIRNVTCRIRPNEFHGYDWEATKVAEVAMAPVTDMTQIPVSHQAQDTGRLAMIRVGQCFEFRFAMPVAGNPDAKIKVRFTDDFGLHWQIDNDLHLEPLGERDW
jgi:hypothetical protein